MTAVTASDPLLPPPQATLRDVAQAASVHPSTASRALRGTGRVHPNTVRRIQAAALDLGYLANSAARQLRQGAGNHRLIAVAYDPDSLTGLTRNAQAFWFFLMLGLNDGLAQRQLSAVQIKFEALDSLRVPVEALLLLSISQSPSAVPGQLANIPVAVNKAFRSEVRASAVFTHDFAAITNKACEHLIESGARRIACLPLSDRDFVSADTVKAYRNWCAQNAMTPTVLQPYQRSEQIREMVRAETMQGLDGIFAVNGDMAAVFDGVAAAGLRCPDDVLIVGTGQGVMEPQFRPPLTSIFLDGEGSGQAIAALLGRLLAQGTCEEVTQLPWELIIRGSTTRD